MLLAEAILIFTLVTNAGLGLSVIFSNPRRSQNQLYLAFSAAIAVWILFLFGILKADFVEQAELGIKGAAAAGVAVPVVFYLFCQSIAYPQKPVIQIIRNNYRLLTLSLVVALLCATPLFLKTASLPAEGNSPQITDAHFGSTFPLFIAFFPIIIYRTIRIFFRTLGTAEGLARVEMQFTLIGMTSVLPVSILIFIIAVISGSDQPQQYSPLCIIPMNLAIAYGIATRRMLGIESIIQKSTANILLAAFLSLLLFSSWHTVNYLFADVIDNPVEAAWFVSALLTLLAFPPAKKYLHIGARKLISDKSMNVPETLKRANEIIQSVPTIDALTAQFLELVEREAGATTLRYLSLEGDRYIEHGSTGFEVEIGNALILCLASGQSPVCRDSLKRTRETSRTNIVFQQMEKFETAMAVGAFAKSELIGVLLLGNKKARRIYNLTEQDALQTLCNQFAIARENARMYTEMQNSKIRNEIMLDQLANGVIVANPDRTITLFNKEARRITGLQGKKVLNQKIDMLPNPIFEALEKTLERARGVRNIEAELIHAETETVIDIQLATASLSDLEKQPMGALLVVTDITETKNLEQQLRRTDQLSSVGTLAAGMAHEIKNPLVTIKTFTQLLPHRYSDEDFRNEFSVLVAQEVTRIDGIVNDLLSFSKPAKPNLVPMQLHDTIHKTLKLLNKQMMQKNIKLENNCTAANASILGDDKLLSQALINLSLNAIEAIDSDGTISVRTTNCDYLFAPSDAIGEPAPRPCIRLQISDTGSGISKEDQPKIFDPFFTRKTAGTGMGLSVSHGIITEHHGAIEVESEPERGTTFYVYLPTLAEVENG